MSSPERDTPRVARPMPRRWKVRTVSVLAVLLAGGIAAFDGLMPLGIAGGVAYVLVILVVLRSDEPKLLWAAAVGCTALVGLGAVTSPQTTQVPMWIVGSNRAIALVGIWSVTIMGIQRMRAEAGVRAMVETSVDAIATIDAHGTVLSFNRGAENVFGWRESEILGRNVAMLMPSPHRERHDGYIERYLRTGEARIIGAKREVLGLRKDGSTVPLELSVSEIEGQRGLFTGIMRDISQRRTMERQLRTRTRDLEAINRELESFTYSVSHDLRAPLRAIDGYSQILLEDHAAQIDDEGQRLLGIVRRNTEKMGRLIDDLLAFSRLGRQAMESSRVDMGRIAGQVWKEQIALEEHRDVQVHIGELPPAWGDRNLLTRVWDNLIGNALKYTKGREPAVIEIDGHENGDTVVYRIRDNGVGFDMQYADKLFGVFQRLHTESEYPGTGLGLALVQRIVHRHDGEIAGTGAVDRGATFTVTLPRREPS